MGAIRRRRTRVVGGVLASAVCLLLAGGVAMAVSGSSQDKGAASEQKDESSVRFSPEVPFDRARLVVTGPDGFVLERTLGPGDDLAVAARGLPDGSYTYELELVRTPSPDAFVELDEADENGRRRVLTEEAERGGPYSDRVSGSFTVSDGAIVQPAAEPEGESR